MRVQLRPAPEATPRAPRLGRRVCTFVRALPLWFAAPWALPLFFSALPDASAADPAERGDLSGSAGARVDIASDAWLSVLSPLLSGRVSPGALDVEATYRVDILSGATPSLVADAISSATTFDEERHEVSVGARHRLASGPDDRVGLGYTLSLERDYVTHALSLSAELALFDRHATLTLGYDLSLEAMGSAADPSLSEPSQGHALSAGWTHVLARGTSLSLRTTLLYNSCAARFGCLANPYRYVGVLADDTLLFAAHERHPDALLRGAAALRLAQYLGADLALHLGYRLYADSWSVLGHTYELALAWAAWSDRVLVRLESRLATQGAASFFERRYTASPDAPATPSLRTGDPALGGTLSYSIGLATSWELGPLFIDLGLSRFTTEYDGAPTRRLRATWLLGGGLRVDL